MVYNPALDGLRALAALSVLLFHASVPPFFGGGRGVDVFFVLSGYLITALLVQEQRDTGRINPLQFWRKRAARLLPALFLMVAAYVALAPVLLPGLAATRWRDAGLTLAYVMNYSLALDFRTSGLQHAWSLAVEEHFYLVWPFVVPWLMKLKRPGPVLLATWAALTAVRAGFALKLPFHAIHYPTHFHVTGIILGAGLVFIRPPLWLARPGALLLAFMLTVMAASPALNPYVGLTFAPLGEMASAALIGGLLAPSTWLHKVFAWEPARRLGLISYGIYLWHWPVYLCVADLPMPQRTVLTLAGAISLAMLSYMTIERWAKAFRPTQALQAA